MNLLQRAKRAGKYLASAAVAAVGITGAANASTITFDATDPSNVPVIVSTGTVVSSLGVNELCNDGICIGAGTTNLNAYNFATSGNFVGAIGAGNSLTLSSEFAGTSFQINQIDLGQARDTRLYNYFAELAGGAGTVAGTLSLTDQGTFNASDLGVAGQNLSAFSFATQDRAVGFRGFSVETAMSAVPGPESGILLLTAMAGGAAYARRRSSGRSPL